MNSEKTSPAKPPRKPRRWLRTTLRVLGWTLLVLAIFHRPLIHYGVPLVVKPLAARQHLSVDFKLGGTIFTTLLVTGVHVVPNGTGSTPVQKIDIAELRFHYSIIKLVRDGIGAFLHGYQVHHADLVFVAEQSKTKEEKDQKVTIAQQLNNILAQPAAYADRVWIDDFTVRVKAPDSETVIGPLYLSLDPEKEGELHIGRVQAPGVPVWESLSATTSYQKRNLFIRGLQLTPQLLVEELNFEPSPEKKKSGTMRLKAQVFGGNIALQLSGSELPKPGEKLEKSYTTNLRVSAAGIDLPALTAYFGVADLPVGQLQRLDLEFTGEPEKPDTWKSAIAVQVARVAAGPIALEPVELSGESADGKASVRGTFAMGENKGQLTAQSTLPASIKDFPQSAVDAQLTVTAPRLDALGAALPTPVKLGGGVELAANFSMREGKLATDGKVTLREASFATNAVKKGSLDFRVSKPVKSDPAAPLAGLSADITANLDAITAGNFAIDSVRLSAAAENARVEVRSLQVQRGENTIEAKGSYLVPADMKEFAASPADVNFTIHVPTLESFGLGSGERMLAGKVEGRGAVKTVRGLPEGVITIDGSDFQFGGATARSLSTKVTIANGSAVLDQLTVTVDEKNDLAASGKMSSTAPFAYEARLGLNLRDFSGLQRALESFGVKEELAGSASLDWTGSGELQPARHAGDVTLSADAVHYGKVEVREARLAGSYTPEIIQTRQLHVVSGPTALDAGDRVERPAPAYPRFERAAGRAKGVDRRTRGATRSSKPERRR